MAEINDLAAGVATSLVTLRRCPGIDPAQVRQALQRYADRVVEAANAIIDAQKL